MDDQNLSKEQLLHELTLLRQEVAELKTAKAAFNAQSELLEHLVGMARTSSEEQKGEERGLKATLKKTLDVCARLTNAERGSLFLLDKNGAVIASLLTRKDATAEESKTLIGMVLDKGLAGWVARQRQAGLIVDTDTDDRWITVPNQPYVVRSALAVPIIRGQDLLGILTLLHSEPQHFINEDANLMQATADQIALVLENAELYTKLDESYTSLDKTKRALQNELDKGRQIQNNFLPDRLIQPSGWEIAACFYPARDVAGDFYDAFLLPGDYVGVVIADVCDKGVGAALFMALFRSLIRVFSGQTHLDGLAILGNDVPANLSTMNGEMVMDAGQINALKAVALTNNYIADNHGEMGMFATLFFGVLNPTTGILTYINGGHEPPIIVNQGQVKQRLKPTGAAVGMMPNMKFKIQQVQLEPGDILVTYTDGVPEARCPTGEFFTEKRLLSLMEEPASSAGDLVQSIYTNLCSHIAEAAQFDDITMLVLHRW